MVNIGSFADVLTSDAGAWKRMVFTGNELRDALTRPSEFETLAGKWAAKEAFVKAWSSFEIGVPPKIPDNLWSEIEILRDVYSRPLIRLTGRTKRAFEEEHPNATITLSISHDSAPHDTPHAAHPLAQQSAPHASQSTPSASCVSNITAPSVPPVTVPEGYAIAQVIIIHPHSL
ncbi:MAG: 4'-phosphopantetheinyl transferase superfamily protein [Candidatus Ancillula sp.]|nr:4'-phosphopantetheinyl transferase superfamily protein [Candidatus Ancillula sp.]